MHERKANVTFFICFHNLLLASKNQPFVKRFMWKRLTITQYFI